MKYFFTLLFLCISSFHSQNIWAAPPTYPSLTGRVVDQAGILTSAQKDQLSAILQQHEQKTSNQVVVAIIRSLEGHDIAEYAVGLFRYWQLGQKNKNNGILLLVAINDREIDIEVGYGLEGTLTDAISHNIIQEKITPFFKKGDYAVGIRAGVDSILLALDGQYVVSRNSADRGKDNENQDDSISWFILGPFLLFFIIAFLRNRRGGGGGGGFPTIMGGRSSGGRSGSGGFSGGGGSSGGGGARGSW